MRRMSMRVRRALAFFLAMYIAVGTAVPARAFTWGPKTTISVMDTRPDYVIAGGEGREFDYDDGEVAVTLRVSGTARVLDAEYGEDADRFDAGAGFGVLVPREVKIPEDAEVELEIERRGEGDEGYDEVVAEAGEAYDDLYGVVGLVYKFYLDGHELDMSGCTVEIRAGWGQDALDNAFGTFSEELDAMDSVPEDLGLNMSAYVMADDGPVLAASGSAMPDAAVFGTDGEGSGDGMLDIAVCMDRAAVERVEADMVVLPENEIPMAELPEEEPGFFSNIWNSVVSLFSEDAGIETGAEDSEGAAVGGETESDDLEIELDTEMMEEDNSQEESTDGSQADNRDDSNTDSDAWIVVDEFGTWLVVGTGANPEYTVEYYAFIPEVVKSEAATGDINTNTKGNKLPVIDTRNKRLPENNKGDSNSPNGNKIQVLEVDTSNPNMDAKPIQTVDKFVEIYESETWHYQNKPQMVYIDKVSSNLGRKTNYELVSVWVRNEMKETLESTEKDLWDVYMLEDMYTLEFDNTDVNQPAGAESYKSMFSKEDVTPVVDLFKQLRFVTDLDNAEIDRPDQNEYGKIYYIDIKSASNLRLVYEPVTKDKVPGSNETVSRQKDIKCTFYDYDIEGRLTDEELQVNPSLTNHAVWAVQKGEPGEDGYVAAHGYGINSPIEGTGTQLVFGNRFGTGLWAEKWNGNLLNMANKKAFGVTGSYGGCTFGLAEKLSADGHVQYSDGLLVPSLFGESDDTEGKRVYADSNLTFKQVGDTYTLYEAKVNDEKATPLTDLDLVEHPQCGPNPVHEYIYTNNFWPFDGIGDPDETDQATGEYGAVGEAAGLYVNTMNSGLGMKYGKYQNVKYNVSDDGKAHNNFFGMHYTVDFSITKDYVGPLEYLFFGDDDMWVFLSPLTQSGVDEDGKPVYIAGEGQLICDIGGVHSAVGEYVDLWDYISKTGRTETQYYRLSFFYTERGMSGSTCYMQFTLPSVSQVLDARELRNEKAAVTVSKQVGRKTGDSTVDIASGSEATDEKFTFTLFFQDVSGKPISTDTGVQFEVKRADGSVTPTSALLTLQYDESTKPDKISDVYKDLLGEQTGCQVQLGQGDSVTVYNLDANTKYYIIEERTGRYEPAVILNGVLNSAGDVSNGEEGQYSWQYGDNVVQGSITGTQKVDVTYVNQELPDYKFPDTGGSGVEIFIISGAAMALIGISMIAWRRKRNM